ncbi:exodeoxyribonuclease V subunit gamma [Aliidiomarina soli]|uniref:RecBCD enzyme subunit RecC n=1 Tax=Aliidiomarina soli TaxID=1928574 RepID=A0A432WLQ6_9GAMM|nr:exodeoxyribonuclease V subunit gamma [Aliidiomarina soli]RUO34694.1 exodeoxyribonuclease V subunit gamma [Aliidiomarina soli]
MHSLTPGFIAAHSHRLEDLTEVAVKLMAAYPLAPLQEEAILVQSNGIAQWLKTELATTTGIATMLDVTLPARFVWRAYRAVLGDDIPRHSPYDKDRLRWRLMRLLPDLMQSDPIFAQLQNYVADDSDQRKLFQLSDKLADLLDQYQVYRAEWLDAWTRGDDVLLEKGQALPLDQNQRWQPALWRALVADIGIEEICSNRAALHRRFIEQAQALDACPAGLPPRVIVFGISSLPRQTLEVLHALKGVCQVMLCVHNPCQYHWADIIDGRELFGKNLLARHANKGASLDQVEGDQLHLHAHPLLASWGKQGRDYIRLLDEFDETRQVEGEFADLRFDLFSESEPQNLLQQLQSDILHLRPLHETQQMWGQQLAANDRSIAFHRCHSPQREVEVLHDQLLAAFASDPQLQPRDVMVMVPDINNYAPYIDAVFGRLQRNDKRYIPYTIADQGQRHRNPMLIALDLVLAAPQQRFTHSDIFDLLHVPALQQRFGLQHKDVELLQQWSAEAGARWGLQALHRQSLGLEISYQENSWLFALKRMLYGYAAGDVEGEPWQGIEPYSEVAGMQAQAAGALAELVRVLEHYWQALAQSRSAAEWHPLLQGLLDDLFRANEDSERLLLNRLRDGLDSWLESVNEASFNGDLRYNIVQEVWLSGIDEGSLNQRFMAGAVNFSTLMPMRAIPFSKVCLLGMNDADYPRSVTKADFDLMVGHYQPGDRSRREDDRYLFLEALLSAREQLYISWVGMSAQDNTELPPSVLIGQLQDHLDLGWSTAADVGADGEQSLPSQQLTQSHRLQPFSAAYFARTEPAGDYYFTYAREWAAVHMTGNQNPALVSDNAEKMPVLPPYQAESSFSLFELELLLKQPAELFARKRLGVRLDNLSSESFDDETFSFNKLDEWKVKHELVTTLLATTPMGGENSEHSAQVVRQCFSRIRRRAQLPLSFEADLLQQTLSDKADAIAERLRGYWHAGFKPLAAQPFDMMLGNYQLQGELGQLYQNPDQPAQVTQLLVKVSKVADIKKKSATAIPRHALPLWLQHLVAQVVVGDNVQLSSVLIGDGASISLPAQSAATAQAQLQALGKQLDQALLTPLPVALSLAWQWLNTEREEEKLPLAEKALLQAYEGGRYSAAERDSLPYLARFFPQGQDLLDAGFASVAEELYLPFIEAMQGATIQGDAE